MAGQLLVECHKPVILHTVLTSVELLAEACRSFSDRCAVGIQPDEKRIEEHLDHSLMLVTALNPHIGYEKAAKISLTAYRENLSLREAALKLGFLTGDQFDQVKCSAMVNHADGDGLMIESFGRADSIASKTVIWAGGITASPLGTILANRTKAEIDQSGKVKVKPDLTLPNYPDIYVVGDLACSTDAHGKPLPGLAQVAMQGGTHAAKAILRKVNGRSELRPFHYFDKGSLAVIGRAAAVAEVFGLQISGLPAWLIWAFTYLVTFQSRILVFIQWAIQDLKFNRGSRLITGVVPTDFNLNKELSTFRIKPQPEPEPLREPH